MTETELLESLKCARQAMALASWGVARAIPSYEPPASSPAEPPSGEDRLTGALHHFRQARRALGKARGRWQHRATLMASLRRAAASAAEPGGFDSIGAELERCEEEIALGNLERIAPAEAL